MDAVGIGKLATLQAIHHIHRIILILTLLIRLLDTTARGRIIMGNSETDHRPIRHVDRPLDKSLAKGTTPNDYTSILILNGTSDNLCGRGRITIDKHDDLTFLENATTICCILGSRSFPALSIHNQVSSLQKFVGYINGSLQIATTILL